MWTLVSFFCLLAQANAYELKGAATTLDGHKQLYSEIHTILIDEKGLNKKIETRYLKPNGQLFAEMTSDFSVNKTIPIIKFNDQRFDRTEELQFNEKADAVIFKSGTGTKTPKTKEIKISANMVAGQGFDNFVKINFENLQQKTVPLAFGVLAKMDFYSFSGHKINNSEKNKVQFGIDLSSFFLRLFSSELILDYDIQTKQILSYRGLSNLLSDDGQPQDVWIKYEVKTTNEKP